MDALLYWYPWILIIVFIAKWFHKLIVVHHILTNDASIKENSDKTQIYKNRKLFFFLVYVDIAKFLSFRFSFAITGARYFFTLICDRDFTEKIAIWTDQFLLINLKKLILLLVDQTATHFRRLFNIVAVRVLRDGE